MFKDLFKLFIWTVFFTLVVFFIKTTFFTDDKVLIEEKYIEPTIELKEIKNTKNTLTKALEKKTKNNLNSANKYYFVYIPGEIKSELKDYYFNIKTYIENDYLLKTITELRINFYAESKDRRGKMKNKTVKIFNPEKMGEKEALNIFIHEFAHYIDLYFFENKRGKDLSNEFYNISWITTTTLRKGQNKSDFVSGYAMTNKYEDFAESFTYFVISNEDFAEKSESSEILKNKYDFFANTIFKYDFLKNTKFSKNIIIKDYYRDTTKLDIDLEKFLHYFKK